MDTLTLDAALPPQMTEKVADADAHLSLQDPHRSSVDQFVIINACIPPHRESLTASVPIMIIMISQPLASSYSSACSLLFIHRYTFSPHHKHKDFSFI